MRLIYIPHPALIILSVPSPFFLPNYPIPSSPISSQLTEIDRSLLYLVSEPVLCAEACGEGVIFGLLFAASNLSRCWGFTYAWDNCPQHKQSLLASDL